MRPSRPARLQVRSPKSASQKPPEKQRVWDYESRSRTPPPTPAQTPLAALTEIRRALEAIFGKDRITKGPKAADGRDEIWIAFEGAPDAHLGLATVIRIVDSKPTAFCRVIAYVGEG